jgi:cytochrome c2
MNEAERANPSTTIHNQVRGGMLVKSLLAAVTLMLLALVAVSRAQDKQNLEGDPFRGRQIFSESGCIRCHSIWGHGGTLGPDIAVAVVGKSWYELVGDFWNHTPRMIDEVTARGYAWPTLEPAAMADTLSYLYYLRLFDEPGNATRGGDTYERLQCGACHTLRGQGGSGGGPLDRFGAYPSPAPLAQAMWNAGPTMQQAQLSRGNPIPRFAGHEMADLQAYIRDEGLRKGSSVELLPLPDPARGAQVFRAKGCGVCHQGPKGKAPDITRSALSKTVSEITGLLWNHSYAMNAEMAAAGIPMPRFAGTEMSDLISHLYFLGYIGDEGNPKAGSTVFGEKGCAGCHVAGGQEAPDLTTMSYRTDRAALAAAMWNHAPQMHRVMAERSQSWPKFEPGEMRNLAAYLRSIASKPQK